LTKTTSSSLRIGTAPFALALALVASPAFAQETTEGDSADDVAEEGEAIVVTGSRIARPEIESSVPVAVLSAETLASKGQTNVYDALRDNPISGQNTLDRSGSNFSNFNVGVATANLRNLGVSRTLTLINGRRSIGIPGNTAVDLNNIPVDLIDHIEIVTGGTSAVYGSDAVAGVVNVILKNHFEGLQVHGQATVSDKGDAATRFASVTGGTAFAGGAGHVVLSGTYEDSDPLRAIDRSFSSYDTPSNSSYAAQGLFDPTGTAAFNGTNGSTFTFSPTNVLKPYQGAAIDGYTRARDRLLVVPITRYMGNLLADFEFSPAATLYAEATYSRNEVQGSIEALAVDDSGAPGQSVLNFDGSAFLGIPVTNPLVPLAIRQAAIANGQQFINFRRRSNEIFDRSSNENRNFYRGVLGLKGELTDGWNYDASYEHSRYRTRTFSEAILLNNYGAALQAITLNGQVVCADPAARAAGCVPINIFGFNTVTPEQVQFLSTYTGVGGVAPGASAGDPVYSEYRRRAEQDVASLNITGSLFELPAGPLGVAFGLEYHSESAEQLYDPYTIAGISSSQQATNTIGKYNSKEAYAEVSIPVIADSFIHELTIEGAARYADYSTVGGTWSYKIGGTLAPVRDLRLRGMYAQAVRAPNINELFADQSLTAIQVIDPCDQNQGNGELAPGESPALAALPAGCASIPGISATAAANGGRFVYTLAQVQTAYGFLGGNPDLTAEKTRTITLGGTFSPSFFRGFDLSVDYYDVKVLNAISAVDQQTSVDQCFLTGDAQFCGPVRRNAQGFIEQVDAFQLNAASYQVAGLDVQARYSFDPGFFGPDGGINLALFWNHKFKQEQTPFAGGPVKDEIGTADQYAGSQLGTGFKDTFTLSTNIDTGNFGFDYKVRYMSGVTASSGVFDIPAYWYHDARVSFTLDDADQFEFYAGVNNLFDKEPPLITSGNGQWPGTNTVADTYDLFGRMLYAGVRAKF